MQRQDVYLISLVEHFFFTLNYTMVLGVSFISKRDLATRWSIKRIGQFIRHVFHILSTLFVFFCFGLYLLGLVHSIDMLPRSSSANLLVWSLCGWMSFPIYLGVLLGMLVSSLRRHRYTKRFLLAVLAMHCTAGWIFPPLLAWTVIYLGAPLTLLIALRLILWDRS